jgi:hypothetical protein
MYEKTIMENYRKERARQREETALLFRRLHTAFAKSGREGSIEYRTYDDHSVAIGFTLCNDVTCRTVTIYSFWSEEKRVAMGNALARFWKKGGDIFELEAIQAEES